MPSRATMSWLAPHPDFRSALSNAVLLRDPQLRWQQLVALAGTRLGYVETIQLDNALRRHLREAEDPNDPPEGPTPLRVALLASSTVDHLLPAIRIAGLRRGLLLKMFICGFGQYRQALLDESSTLHAFKPEYVVFSIGASELTAGIAVDAAAGARDALLNAAVRNVAELWKIARERFGATVIQQTLLNVAEPLFGSFDALVAGSPTQRVERANALLVDAAAHDRVLLLDVACASARDGLDVWFDRARWLQGKIEIAPQAAPCYGDLVGRIIAAQRGLSKKCLVLDLDNTLWGGVIGDDGPGGIRLGEGSAVGEAHAALQRYAKALKERGVVLAVASKNDPSVVEAMFRDHPEMVLRPADIATFAVNWHDKAHNLKEIAQRLNIGLDSLVFVDDNPVERARIRASLPMVAVPELPADATYYVQTLADAGYFEAASFTDEDRERTGQYVANVHRYAVRDLAQTMDDFLRGLGMSVEFGAVTPQHLMRAAQLINKTNQFNTTTRRYTEDALRAIAADPDCVALRFRLADRFGDNGLVCVMVLKPLAGEPGVLEIDTWVMSCRVFGRQLEFEAMNIAVETAVRLGARELRADFVPTQRNAVVSGLYERLGFSRVCAAQDLAPATRWSIRLELYRPTVTFIDRKPT